MAQENLNPFETSQRQFDTAAEKIGLDDGMREVLRNPKRQLIVSVPTLMDDGSPLYKDAGHLRPTYVRKHATFLDPTVSTFTANP